MKASDLEHLLEAQAAIRFRLKLIIKNIEIDEALYAIGHVTPMSLAREYEVDTVSGR